MLHASSSAIRDSDAHVVRVEGSYYKCEFTGHLPLPVVAVRHGGVWRITCAGAAGGNTMGTDGPETLAGSSGAFGSSMGGGCANGQRRSRRGNPGGAGAVVSACFTLSDGAALVLGVGGKAAGGSGAGGGASFVSSAIDFMEDEAGVRTTTTAAAAAATTTTTTAKTAPCNQNRLYIALRHTLNKS